MHSFEFLPTDWMDGGFAALQAIRNAIGSLIISCPDFSASDYLLVDIVTDLAREAKEVRERFDCVIGVVE